MAMAVDVIIAQVSEMVDLVTLNSEHIITVGIFVKHVEHIQPKSESVAV